MSTKNLVTLSVADHVADVRLNRPKKYNALSPDMFKAITAMGDALVGRDDIRAVVFSGEGPGFCSGLDMGSFRGMASPKTQPKTKTKTKNNSNVSGGLRGESIANAAQASAYVWKAVPVPVIAALHGVVYGGGLQIALGADIRLAAADTRFSIMEIKWGLIPDMALTQTVRDLLPLDVAKELMFTGRVFNAEEADRLGIVTRVVDNPHAEAMAMAQEIASKSPDAIRAGKQLLDGAWRDSPEAGLALEEKLQLELMGSDNQVEAILANFEKRPPKFS